MNKEENNILEELLKQIPELKKDEKNLEKIIEIIKKNNPEININKDFKQNLKFRLDSIMEYRQEIKKTFFGKHFFVPIFSVFLIMGGFFYVYKGISLLEESNIKYQNTNILEEKNNIENDQIIEILGETSNNDSFDNSRRTIIEAPSVIMEETMLYDNGNNRPYINSFEEYCEEYSVEVLLDKDGIRYCIIEEKICMESDYSNNTCKLTQKK